SLKGVDVRILTAQVPGGMLTNMESQLKEQGALDRLDEVLEEIPRVRKDLGYIPLVTPTSQIVGTQAVINVMSGQRYATISKETQGVVKGEYGAPPAPVDKDLQAQVLAGAEPITCRPADLLQPEMVTLTQELKNLAASKKLALAPADREADDVLTYALFTQIGLKFLENRNNPAAFEPAPGQELDAAPVKTPAGDELYTVAVEGREYTVTVSDGGDITGIAPIGTSQTHAPVSTDVAGGAPVNAPLAGIICKALIEPGQAVVAGEAVVMLAAMKMETAGSAPAAGVVDTAYVSEAC